MPRRAPQLIAAGALMALAVAGAAQAGDPVKVGDQGALGLVGPKTPDLLKDAKADPYAPPAEPVCETARAELDQLSQVLGPDADAPPEKKPAVDPGKMVGGAIKGLIPHRGVLRFLTGAGKKEEALNEAVMAGWARRGYLKGLIKARKCDAPAETGLQQTATNPAGEAGATTPASPQAAPAEPTLQTAAAAPAGTDAAAIVPATPQPPASVAPTEPAPPAAAEPAAPQLAADAPPAPVTSAPADEALAAAPAR